MDNLRDIFRDSANITGNLPRNMRAPMDRLAIRAKQNGDENFLERESVNMWMSERTGIPMEKMRQIHEPMSQQFFGAADPKAAWGQISAAYEQQDAFFEVQEQAQAEKKQKMSDATHARLIYQANATVVGGGLSAIGNVLSGGWSQVATALEIGLTDPNDDEEYSELSRKFNSVDVALGWAGARGESGIPGADWDSIEDHKHSVARRAEIVKRIDSENIAKMAKFDGSIRDKSAKYFREWSDRQYKFADEIYGMVGSDERFRSTFVGQMVSSAGSLPVTAVMAIAGPMGWIGMESMMFGQAEAERRQHEGADYDPHEAWLGNTLTAAPQAILERALGIERMLANAWRVTPKVGSKVAFGDFLRNMNRRGLRSGAEEAVVEPLQGQWGDFIAKKTYDEKRELFSNETIQIRALEAVAAFGLGYLFGGAISVDLDIQRNQQIDAGQNYLLTKHGGLLTTQDFKVMRSVYTDKEIVATAPDEEMGQLLLDAANGDKDAFLAYQQETVSRFFEPVGGKSKDGWQLGKIHGKPAIIRPDGAPLVFNMKDPEQADLWDRYTKSLARKQRAQRLSKDEQAKTDEGVDAVVEELQARHGDKLNVSRESIKSLRQQVTDGDITQDQMDDAIEGAIADGQLDAGVDPDTVQVLGKSSLGTDAEGHAQMLITLAESATPATVIEENGESWLKLGYSTGQLSKAQVREARRSWYKTTGEADPASESKNQDRADTEWFSSRLTEYALSKRKTILGVKAGSAIGNWLITLGDRLRGMLKGAAKMKKLMKDGKLDPKLEAWFKQALGDKAAIAQQKVDDVTTKAMQETLKRVARDVDIQMQAENDIIEVLDAELSVQADRIMVQNGWDTYSLTAPDTEPEQGTPAPDTDTETIKDDEGESIPWTPETYSLSGPDHLPETFPNMTDEIYDKILAETPTIAAIHIDRMRVGSYEGTDLQGGMFYPSIVENLKAGIGWAFNGVNVARDVARRAKANGGYVKLLVMGEGNVVGNKTFGHIWFNAIEKSIKSRKLTKKAALTELNRIRENHAKITGHDKAWKTITQAREEIIGMGQMKRGKTYFSKGTTAKGERTYGQLLSKTLTKSGFPDTYAIVEAIEEPSFKGLPNNTPVGIIKFDEHPEDQPIPTGSDLGVTEHASYAYVLKGKPVARLTKFVSVDETFPDVAKKIMSQQHTDFNLDEALKHTYQLTGIPSNEEQSIAGEVEAMGIAQNLAKDEVIKDLQQSESHDERIKRIHAWGLQLALSKALVPLSGRLQRLALPVAQRMRRMEMDIGKQQHEDIERIRPFLEGLKKIRKTEDFTTLDLALKNGNTDARDEILTKYGIDITSVEELLSDIRKRLTDAGYEVGQIDNYFPRKVEDLEGLNLHYHGKPKGTRISQEIKKAKAAANKAGRSFTVSDEELVVNSYLNGRRHGKAGPTATKKRVTIIVEPEANVFYADSMDALMRHIQRSAEAVGQSKFFGKHSVRIPHEAGSVRLGNLDVQASVGLLVQQAVDDGDLSSQQQEEVKAMIEARFNQGVMDQWARHFKDLSYITTMGQITSTLTQIGDLAFSIYENGWAETVTAAGQSIAGRSPITREQLGIESINADFSSPGKLHAAVDRVFTITGLKAFDRVGKETLMNAKLNKLQKQAASGQIEQKTEDIMAASFTPEQAAQVRLDLAAGIMSDDVLFLGYNTLANYQPINLSEFPEAYLRMPNGRALYMLKTFTIKQLEAFRREGIQDFLTGKTPADKARGLKNFMHLAAIFWLIGVPVDWIKDMIRGRPVVLNEIMLDNLLKLGGISRYNMVQFRRDPDPVKFVMGYATPPAPWLTYPLKDLRKGINSVANGDEYKPAEATSWRMIPILGGLYHDRLGAGRGAIERRTKKPRKSSSSFR